MSRSFSVFLGCVVCALLAVHPINANAQSCAKPPGYPDPVYNTNGKTITYYVPHNAQGCARSMEGCIATSCLYAEPINGDYVKTPVCLDAVRLKEAKYVTLSSAASNYGKYFNLGTITYRSALDNQMHTVENVVGYVHDTGCAFNGTCSEAMKARYGFSSSPRPDKIDICTTICPTCSDQEAGNYALGKNVARMPSGKGITDVNSMLYAGSGNPYGQSISSLLLSQPPQQAMSVSTGQGASVAPSPQSTTNLNQPQGTPGTGSGTGGFTGGTTSYTGPSAASLVVQSSTVARGRLITVSWSSIAMRSDQKCRLLVELPNLAPATVIEENSGSQPVRISLSAGTGTGTFRLQCTPLSGSAIEKTATFTVE